MIKDITKCDGSENIESLLKHSRDLGSIHYDYPTFTAKAKECLDEGGSVILTKRNAIVTLGEYREWGEEAEAVVVNRATYDTLVERGKETAGVHIDPLVRELFGNTSFNITTIEPKDKSTIWTSSQHSSSIFDNQLHRLAQSLL